MLSSSPLLDLVRAGAFVMLLFAAILIWVVIRNLDVPVTFGTRAGPILTGIGLILFALPIYGDVAGVESLADNGSIFRLFAGATLPVGLYLMRPLTPAYHEPERTEPDEEPQ